MMITSKLILNEVRDGVFSLIFWDWNTDVFYSPWKLISEGFISLSGCSNLKSSPFEHDFFIFLVITQRQLANALI